MCDDNFDPDLLTMSDDDFDLLDYEEEGRFPFATNPEPSSSLQDIKSSNASIHSTGFHDFLLKPEILRAIADCGFKQPTEVQHECIPQAILGRDVLCEAKPGMGKTTVFALATLQQLELKENVPYVLVLWHTLELAFQIRKQYKRFAKYMPTLKVDAFFRAAPLQMDVASMKSSKSHIVVGTPERILALMRSRKLNLQHLTHIILDECEQILNQKAERYNVREIFSNVPQSKQVMMFSGKLNEEIRLLCKIFMQNPLEVYLNDKTYLILNRLQQHYVQLGEHEKNRKLFQLLDVLEFNQVVIFVKSIKRCKELVGLLRKQGFSVIDIHRGMDELKRLKHYQQFKDFEQRILVETNLSERGMDIARENVVFNYDMPDVASSYLHRVARVGRFGIKGLAISFVSDDADARVLQEVRDGFDVTITKLPDEIDLSTYIDGYSLLL